MTLPPRRIISDQTDFLAVSVVDPSDRFTITADTDSFHLFFLFFHLLIGTVVEARFQKKKAFYRGKIMSRKYDTDGVQELFTVKYEIDGVIERGKYASCSVYVQLRG